MSEWQEPSLDRGPVSVEVAKSIAEIVGAKRSEQTVPPRWMLVVWNRDEAEKASRWCRDGIVNNTNTVGRVDRRKGWAALRRRLHLLVPQVCATCGETLDQWALSGWGFVDCTPCRRQRVRPSGPSSEGRLT